MSVTAVRSSAQELSLRRDVPAPAPRECAPSGAGAAASARPEDAQEASRLAASAREASLLGDLRTARDLLGRAARLDPASENIAFLHARTLEELGEVELAADEYCRYVQLTENAAEAEQVRQRVSRIAPPSRPGIPDSAAARFSAALAAADEGRFAAAELGFTAVIEAAPAWAAPLYNRALLRARNNMRADARQDLERFLVLEPDAPDADRVRSWMSQLATPFRTYSPGTSFALGLIPGAGHFYTGRPIMGTALLALGAGAATAGVLYQTRHVECLTVPVDGVCPPDQVLREYTERPYQLPALGVAAAASILGALDAALGARRRNARGPALGAQPGGARAALLADVTVTPARVDVAFLQLRF